MSNQTNYKRTVAGSVGAGMGAIFNSSGRTYYILEHKTNSKYHSAGESQKIIIDQIEMGRDSSCQVRFDESFDTVSRKHAAIVRDGQNWQLIHLSTSNPTLVNGRPVEGSYYLQSGDEIQLSVGGPRMGFIVPQGKQALTSSIRLTERMNLFRQQALAPYRRAIWILATVLLLTIVGFGIWNYKLHVKNEELRQEIKEGQHKSDSIQNAMDLIEAQIKELENAPAKPNTVVKYVGGGGGNNAQIAALKAEMERLRKEKEEIDANIKIKKDEIGEDLKEDIRQSYFEDVSGQEEKLPKSDNPKPGIVTDVRDYYPNIYRIMIDDIKLQRGTESRDAGIATEKLDCGTGFILSNGTFVTARQNIQPWINVNGISPTGWRERLAKAVAMGFDVIIQFSAYSTNGPSSKITFSTRDFDVPEDGDIVSAIYTIDKSDWIFLKDLGFTISKEEMKRTGSDYKVTTSSNRAYALYRNTGYAGLPENSGASQSLAGAKDIMICGYTSNSIQNLAAAAKYHKTSTSATDTQAGTILLQDSPSAMGYLGAPAFIETSEGLQVVGVYVGQGRLVPISSCK